MTEAAEPSRIKRHKKDPRSQCDGGWDRVWLLGIGVLRGNKFQKVSDFAVQDGAEPCQDICIQACDGVVVILVELGRLHLSPLA